MKSLKRLDLAHLVANHLPKDGFVNLGIGAPTHVADFLTSDSAVMLHSENGILNIGPKPPEEEEDWDLINAGKMPVTMAKGGSYFDSSLSFSMMRGGHIDIAILGAFQVSEKGDLANWSTGDTAGAPPAIGGAIDLAVGAKQIWVMMDHVTKDGSPRIVGECALPLTAQGVVSRIFTSMAIIDVTAEGLILDAVLQGLSYDEICSATGAPLKRGREVRSFNAEGKVI